MLIITIDGPASSGKGTVARIIAKKLGLHYLESGAIYRALGLMASRYGLTVDDVDKLLQIINDIKIEFIDSKVLVNGEDVTDTLKSEKVGVLSSSIASIASVRSRLFSFQHSFAVPPGLVTDGRDMGSVVFPEADLKVFLHANAEIRAKRRFEQLHKYDRSATIAGILHDIQLRDKQDTERSVAPLTFDSSFKVLDNSHMSIDETVEAILGYL